MRETTSDKQSPTLRKQTIPELQRGQPHLQTGPGSPLGQPQGFLRRLQSAEQVAEASENSHREQTLLPGPHNSKAILSGASLTSAPAAPSPGSGREGEGGSPAVRPTDAIHSAELSLQPHQSREGGAYGSLVPPHSRRVPGERLPARAAEPGCSGGPPRRRGAGARPGVGFRKTPAERGAGPPPSESQPIPAPSSLPHRDMPGTSPQRRQTNFLQQRRCAE